MGILIICGVLFISGIIFLMIRTRKLTDYDVTPCMVWICAIITAIFAAILITCGFICLAVHSQKQKNYQSLLVKREVLVQQINEENPYKTDEEILNDIIYVNEEIRKSKEYKDNFWIGIFYNDLYANIDYIRLVPTAEYIGDNS